MGSWFCHGDYGSGNSSLISHLVPHSQTSTGLHVSLITCLCQVYFPSSPQSPHINMASPPSYLRWCRQLSPVARSPWRDRGSSLRTSGWRWLQRRYQSVKARTQNSMLPNTFRMVAVGVSPTLSGVLSLHQTIQTRLESHAGGFGLGTKVPHYGMWAWPCRHGGMVELRVKQYWMMFWIKR